jgi:hypothetical protein
MTYAEGRRNPGYAHDTYRKDDRPQTVPMHPDDFDAHLAWIRAKSTALKDPFAEKSVYYRIVG